VLGQAVDNSGLSTATKNTSLQDVSRGEIPCDVIRHIPVGLALRHPQSTGLITVIRDIYKHTEITMEQR
jgi:hypothetical protein